MARSPFSTPQRPLRASELQLWIRSVPCPEDSQVHHMILIRRGEYKVCDTHKHLHTGSIHSVWPQDTLTHSSALGAYHAYRATFTHDPLRVLTRPLWCSPDNPRITIRTEDRGCTFGFAVRPATQERSFRAGDKSIPAPTTFLATSPTLAPKINRDLNEVRPNFWPSATMRVIRTSRSDNGTRIAAPDRFANPSKGRCGLAGS